ncbi:MAG: hypothetical protein OEP52_12160, partial [Acidimicrobiia bacterium]|nr:hypothetical protein [Acidimicrobiia bacterium]
ETARRTVASGAALALSSGSGPVGSLLQGLRGNRLARALGLTQADDAAREAIQAWASRPGGESARGALGSLVGDLAFEVGGPFGAAIRDRFPAPVVDRLADEAVEVATHHREGPDIGRAGWWGAVRGVKWLLALGFVGALVSWFFLPPPRGEVPWAIVIAVGSLVVGLGLSRLLEWSGRRRGRDAAERMVALFQDDIARQLERGIGVPLRSIVRERALLGAAHTEVGLLAAEAEANLLASR